MKIQIVTIGKLKSGPETQLGDDYLKRLSGIGRTAGITQVKVSEFAESQAASATLRQQEEASVLTRSLPAGGTRFILDERGQSLASSAFAQKLRKVIDGGAGDIAFLIGGPDGHSEELRSSGQLLSFGPMTWPHRLVRIMLLEQLYRAVTIMLNHPYHRA